MISKEAFLERVKTKVFPKLTELENAREGTLMTGGASLFLFVCCFVLFISTPLEGFIGGFDILCMGFCLMFTSITWIGFKKEQKKLYPEFVSVFFRLLKLSYKQNRINYHLLKRCLLFPDNFTQFPPDDEFSGTFSDTTFSVSERNILGGGVRCAIPLFNGIVIEIPMPKAVAGYTLLFNDGWPRAIPILQRIKLEDSDLTHAYQIFSNDQMEARTILTPIFMERLIHLKKCFRGRHIDVSFFGNHAVFAIHTKQNLFETFSLFRSVMDVRGYERFYDEIRAIYDMIQVLKINNANLTTDKPANEALYQQISSSTSMFPGKNLRACSNFIGLILFGSLFASFLVFLIISLIIIIIGPGPGIAR